MEFYNNFNLNKKKFSLTNDKIGFCLNMTGDALKMAVKRESLTKTQISKIEKYFLSLENIEIEPKKQTDNKFKNQIDKLFNDDYFKEKLTEFINKTK